MKDISRGVPLSSSKITFSFCILWALWHWWMTDPRLAEGRATAGVLRVPLGTDKAGSGPEKDCRRGLFCGPQRNGCPFSSSRLLLLPVLWISFPLLLQVSLPYHIAPFSLYLQTLLLLKLSSNVSTFPEGQSESFLIILSPSKPTLSLIRSPSCCTPVL